MKGVAKQDVWTSSRYYFIERFESKLGSLTKKEIEEKLVFVLGLEKLIKRKAKIILKKWLNNQLF